MKTLKNTNDIMSLKQSMLNGSKIERIAFNNKKITCSALLTRLQDCWGATFFLNKGEHYIIPIYETFDEVDALIHRIAGFVLYSSAN